MQPNMMNTGFYPQQSQRYCPQQPQSTASAVSINIYEPKAYAAPQQPMPQANPSTNPMYAMPQQSMYAMPQQSMYAPQQQMYAPQFMPQQQQIIEPQVIQQQQVIAPAPVAQAPVVPTPVTKEPVVLAPVVSEPVAKEVAVPVVAPVVEPTEATKPVVDIVAINTALASDNIEQQTAAIQKIAEVGQSNKPEAQALLNEDTFKNLAAIVSKDSSALTGVDKEKADTNKVIGMWTLAVLQKNFRNAMDAETTAQGIPNIPVSELPEIDKIIINIKQDPNHDVREAGISALTYIAKPEDKDVLTKILKIAAKQDNNKDVKTAAKEAIKQLPA